MGNVTIVLASVSLRNLRFEAIRLKRSRDNAGLGTQPGVVVPISAYTHTYMNANPKNWPMPAAPRDPLR